MIKSVIITREIIVTVGVLIGVGTILSTYWLKKLKRARVPTEWHEVGEVTKLRLFPLKSAKCLELQEAEATKKGLQEVEKFDKSLRLRDRSFVIYHSENHEIRTARVFPKMIFVEMTAADMNGIDLNAPGMKTLFVEIPNSERNKEVITYGYRNEELPCIDCGDEPAEWVSKYILNKDSGLRLGYYDCSKLRDITKVYADLIDFSKELDNESTGLTSDLSALTLINQASIDDLNQRLESESKVSADNFRTNILICGPNLKPYAEDEWTFVKVGDVILRDVYECVRCLMITNDQVNGVRRKDREPLKTLEKYRMGKGPLNGPVMGQFLKVLKTGNISVGDKVYINK